MKPNIFLTRQLPDRVIAYLREESQLEMNEEDRVLTRDELIAGMRGKSGVICLLTDKMDAEVMDANPQLKVISNYAVGYDNIDVAAATKRGIVVTNTPDVLTGATADMAFALLMAVSRRLIEGDGLVRGGGWTGWAPLQLIGGDVEGATLGLIGLGRIGHAMIKRAQGFDMKVMYWNRTRLGHEEEERLGIRYGEREEVLAESDYISLHAAYNKETHHMIAGRELGLMKRSAYLINTARGPLVDEAALAAALADGGIAGAGLDVYEREPAVTAELLKLPNVVLAPHLGSATLKTRTAMGMKAARNALAGAVGDRPEHVVNKELFAR